MASADLVRRKFFLIYKIRVYTLDTLNTGVYVVPDGYERGTKHKGEINGQRTDARTR
jgi:hypothetical protein